MPPDETPATGGGSRSAGSRGSTRSLPRWLVIVAAALLVARVGTGVYEERHPPNRPELVHWRPIAGAIAEARRAKRPILYDFTADWCPPCQAMKRDVFADPQAAAQIENLYVPVRVLDRQREEGHNSPAVDSLQTRYKVDSFPTLVVVPETGEPTTFAGYGGKVITLQHLTQAAVGFRMGGAFTLPMPGSGHP